MARDQRHQPAPVTLPRVAGMLEAMGYAFYRLPERLLIPWRGHTLIIYIARPAGVARCLSFLVSLRERWERESSPALADVLRAWNHERLGPALSFRLASDGRLVVHGRLAAPVDQGLTDPQLRDIVETAISAGQLAASEVPASLPPVAPTGDVEGDSATLLGYEAQALALPLDDLVAEDATGPAPSPEAGPPRHAADERRVLGELDDFPELDALADRLESENRAKAPRAGEAGASPIEEAPGSGAPRAVSVPRLASSLGDLSVTQLPGSGDIVLAWINGILVSIYVDNGPSLLIKAHWDPSPERELSALRGELVCNDWTLRSGLVKAYCLPAGSSVKVRAEYTVPVDGGRTDQQLALDAATGINQVLVCLDEVSRQACGVSAVNWPGAN
ncbi:YbjN domain-containing protein [Corynebacterium otitidis]|uniref:Sensory transduction regulator n=1 Tax=Corynebacterium otitidis ATCC 51513 TaxID=883169 RepID=I7KIM5_9CORY|nr:YbjN domain-containing protein [Corynebacterium otitidis]EJZ82822.1 hypothetical protein HMPREF9719_00224 [Corynebacterium otitidis ATCC 51513]KKO83542.1 hypothetical protein AAV33_05930 [Corynebacterium otitidis]CCI83040.1 hypothetical protein BN46_0292 [Corynebacterium otitidis ATCC 51513]